MEDGRLWRRCSACKKPIELGATYWICNVSTCNRNRTGLVFCSVSCWEVHLPTAHHRDAWAVERTAPARAQGREPPREVPQGRRRVVRSDPAADSPRGKPAEVLIIASRLREYVRVRSGFNTSDRVLESLSDVVRRVCDEAIQNASRDGRKTVLERDVPRR